MAAFVLGGTHGGAGKSVVAAAVAGALRDRGLEVRSFTIGAALTRAPSPADAAPEHEPSCCAAISGDCSCDGASGPLPQGPACIDLALTPDLDAAIACFHRASEGADISVVDGCMAVLDGVAPVRSAAGAALCGGACGTGDGCGAGGGGRSTAEVARALGLPIVLVVDVAALRGAASIAALLQGYSMFDGGLEVAALILNRARGPDQVEEMRAGLQVAGVKAPIIGFLPQLADCAACSAGGSSGGGGSGSDLCCGGDVAWGDMGAGGHGSLGGGVSHTRPSFSAVASQRDLADLAKRQLAVDLDLLMEIARGAAVPLPAAPLAAPARSFRVAIGVAYDQAFYEYFQQNLSLLAAAGAQLVPFSPLQDTQLPPGVSALLIGGGQPEQWAARLASNVGMLASLRAFAAAGGIVAGEGAGVMYLAASLQTAPQQRHSMAGLLPFHAVALPLDQRSIGNVDIEVTGPCPLLAPGTKLKGFFQRCCEVVVIEERVLQGLGAPAAAGSGSSGAAAGAADSSSGSGGASGPYTHCFQARMQGGAAGAPAVPEGYTVGSVIGSIVHLFLGSCPAAAAQAVQRCLRVDIASTSAATSQAARVALAAAQASAAAALCDSPASSYPSRRLGLSAPPPRSPSTCSDAGARSGASPGCASASPAPCSAGAGGGASGALWRRAGAQSTPDLVRLSQEALAGADGQGAEEGAYWQHGQQPRQRLFSFEGASAAGAQKQQQHGEASQQQQRQLKPIKSMSIPANMHHLGSESLAAPHHQHPPTAAGATGGSGSRGGALPFAVPKRWSLELQKLGSHLSQHVMPGGGSSSGPRQGETRVSKGGGAAGSHRRNGSYGSYARLSAALESDLEPLPEAAAQALANHLPVTGRTHAKMIGLACPLGALASEAGGFGGGLPPQPQLQTHVSPGRVVSSSSLGSLAGHQQQQQLLPGQQLECPSPDVQVGGGRSPSSRCSEQVSESSSSCSAAALAGAGAHFLQQQQQQLYGEVTPGMASSASGASISRRSSQDHLHHLPHPLAQHPLHAADHPPRPPSPSIPRIPSAPNGPAAMAAAAGAAGPLLHPSQPLAHAPAHRRNGSSSGCCSLPARPARGDTVVSLSPSATSTLVALGLGPRLAGVTDACRVRSDGSSGGCGGDAGPEVVCYAVCPLTGQRGSGSGARLHHKIDADAVRRMRPALVVVPCSDGDGPGGSGCSGSGAGSGEATAGRGSCGGSLLDRAVVQKALERSGVLWPESGAVVLYQRCFTLAEVLEFVSVLSSAAGVPDQGAMLCERLRARLRAAAAASRAAAAAASGPRASLSLEDPPSSALPPLPPPQQRVAMLTSYESASSMGVAGHWVPEMLQLLAASSLPGAPAPGEPHLRTTWASLQRAGPHIIILTSPGEGAQEAAARAGGLAALAGWWGVPAVRAGRVYAVDSALLTEPGVELVDGVELLAHLLRPQACAAPPAACSGGSGARGGAPRVLKLTLHSGQRCRPRLLPNFFAPMV